MRRSMLLPVLLVLALSAAGCDRRSPSAGQAEGASNVAAVSPDEVKPGGGAATTSAAGAIDRSHAGTTAPDYAFKDATGKAVTLASFKGRPVLLNLWATWCGPCVKELPTLDALAKREAGKLTVVALSQDMDAGKAAPFLAARHLANLGAFTDASMRWLPAVTTNLPTSILYGADGKERWRVLGDRDWTGAAAAKDLAS
ncbi:TlpA family protein disulfide reductase [Sphingomonas bacterium]|uniref:TlpA family protein disulfide reductase n=1 Tax=Sphingomonas bacterium TaxID=1895847 RepID=UPI0020C6C8E8|nr:TlpA disulfide reductase family protein [Sphingomonas bacterium]